jgi:hypothetical protein
MIPLSVFPKAAHQERGVTQFHSGIGPLEIFVRELYFSISNQNGEGDLLMIEAGF